MSRDGQGRQGQSCGVFGATMSLGFLLQYFRERRENGNVDRQNFQKA